MDYKTMDYKTILRKIHYFFSMMSPVLLMDDQIKKLDEAIELMERFG